jgi:putative transposase
MNIYCLYNGVRGYFAASWGNVTDEVIMEYIRKQEIEDIKNSDNFDVTD